MQTAPAPLFRDPIFDGPTDPTVIYNHAEKNWWLIYTARRANVPCHGVSWVHGTDIGYAVSNDHGATWTYRGVLDIEPIMPGRNTYWAPEVIYVNGVYHMFVTMLPGVPTAWVGPAWIEHYTSADMYKWKDCGRVETGSERYIDACVYPLPGGGFRLWYKDERRGSRTYAVDSHDLMNWSPAGMQTEDCAQEGPNVFKLAGKYWLIADKWDGMAVYSSEDLSTWTRQDHDILVKGSDRPEDGKRGHHADVVVVDENRAYIFYFVHPGVSDRQYGADDVAPWEERRSSIQVALLTVSGGKLVETRTEPFEFVLP